MDLFSAFISLHGQWHSHTYAQRHNPKNTHTHTHTHTQTHTHIYIYIKFSEISNLRFVDIIAQRGTEKHIKNEVLKKTFFVSANFSLRNSFRSLHLEFTVCQYQLFSIWAKIIKTIFF